LTRERNASRRLRRLRWTWGFLAAVILVGAWTGYRSYRSQRSAVHVPGEEIPGITERLSHSIPEDAPHPAFTDVTAEAGIRFRSFAGPRTSQLPEDMGSGAAWGDFDNDGDDDLFVVAAGGSLDAAPERWARSELWENMGDGRFARVEDFPELRIIGMSAAWGDADADGWPDLVVTGYRSLLLFRNREGRFIRDERFPSPDGFWAGASWGDFDNDRDLDLYICGYVRYREEEAERARESLQYGKSVPYTLNPSAYTPERNLLFRNDGDGTFTEVAEALGVANPQGRSLGALWHDMDADGWLDLYVANDVSDNVLYRNREGTFEDISHAAWVADYRGAMGLAAGDWNRDGDDDLFVTHWVAQENALYDSLLVDLRDAPPPAAEPAALPAANAVSKPEMRFMDVADERGLGQSALPSVGWGAEFADLDADGWLDLLVSNGSTFETADEPPLLQPQRMFVFWNRGGDGFHDLATLSPTLSAAHVGRGLAVSDYDGDGDLDVVQVLHGEGVRLLRNDMETGHWMKLRLRSRMGPLLETVGWGEGAAVVATVGGSRLRRAVTGVSYLSQSSRTVHLGLGGADHVAELEVRWPGGGLDRYRDLEADRTWEISEGNPLPRPLDAPVRPVAGHTGAADLDREGQVAFWEVQRRAVQAMKKEGDITRAAELFREALALDPAHEDSLYYLGHCLLQMGDHEGAAEAFRELTRVNRSSHRGWRQWALVRAAGAVTTADMTEAAAALERALEINPEETGALITLAEVEILQGELDSAEQRLRWACRSNPRAVGGFFLLGYLSWKRGDLLDAENHLSSALEARSPEWKPRGSVAEGDVTAEMYREEGLLSHFSESWQGSPSDLDGAFRDLDAHVIARRGELSGN
jgi:enediyne biosynthesis protein E4